MPVAGFAVEEAHRFVEEAIALGGGLGRIDGLGGRCRGRCRGGRRLWHAENGTCDRLVHEREAEERPAVTRGHVRVHVVTWRDRVAHRQLGDGARRGEKRRPAGRLGVQVGGEAVAVRRAEPAIGAVPLPAEDAGRDVMHVRGDPAARPPRRDVDVVAQQGGQRGEEAAADGDRVCALLVEQSQIMGDPFSGRPDMPAYCSLERYDALGAVTFAVRRHDALVARDIWRSVRAVDRRADGRTEADLRVLADHFTDAIRADLFEIGVAEQLLKDEILAPVAHRSPHLGAPICH